MKEVFAGTNFRVACISRSDHWRIPAIAVRARIRPARVVTTELVLVEVLNFFSAFGEHLRIAAADSVYEILSDAEIEVLTHSTACFMDGLAFYKRRSDKEYSLIDCISMRMMRDREITEALTHDDPFRQEGFLTLL